MRSFQKFDAFSIDQAPGWVYDELSFIEVFFACKG